MLLILEIGLTLAAWLRGWKRQALLPMAFVLGTGFCLGLSEGTCGITQVTVSHIAPLLDIAGIAFLVLMIARRKPARGRPPAPTSITRFYAPPGYAAPQAYVVPQAHVAPRSYPSSQQ